MECKLVILGPKGRRSVLQTRPIHKLMDTSLEHDGSCFEANRIELTSDTWTANGTARDFHHAGTASGVGSSNQIDVITAVYAASCHGGGPEVTRFLKGFCLHKTKSVVNLHNFLTSC